VPAARQPNPEPDEVDPVSRFSCASSQIIGPEVIVALGKFAAQLLLRSKSPISQLRGRWFDYHGIMLMPTFHPAYLLRNPADKRVVWEDIQKVMRVLDLRSPPSDAQKRARCRRRDHARDGGVGDAATVARIVVDGSINPGASRASSASRSRARRTRVRRRW
jgi:hypothetical protein